MKRILKIKKWQLLRFRSRGAEADLTEADFLSVGKRAFAWKKQLQTVSLPKTCSAVKTEAFRGCRSLEHVILPSESNVGISTAAFRGCSRLAALTNSTNISGIADRAFADCVALSRIEFGHDLRRIGESAFRGCVSLARLSLPSCLQSIGNYAFADCIGLECVEADARLSKLGVAMFRGCTSLKAPVFPEAVHELPRSLFQNCESIEQLSVPASVKRIGRRAFSGCRALSLAEFDLGCTCIGAYAFSQTPSLQRVVLPHSLKRLGFAAFGLGSRRDKITLVVDNEYMLRRMKRLLFWCGSARCVNLCIEGKSLEERKRERRRNTIEQTPTHLID